MSWAVLLVSPVQAAIFPAGQPEYDYLYDLALRSKTLTPDYSDYQVGPYSITEFGDDLNPFESWRDPNPRNVHTFLFAAEDFRAARQARPTGYESIRAGLIGKPLEKISVYFDFTLDEELAKDENYTGKKWRGFAGDVDQAFLSYTTDRVNLMAGRFGSFWGPRRSLLFSPEQKLDGFGYSVKWGRATVSYRLGALNGLNPDQHRVDQFEPRYVAAHRFDFHLSRRLRIGLFETVVFGGPGRQIDLFYLNPLIFFHGSQLNDNLDDNTMVGFDFDIVPVDRCRLYGQLLVDDIQLDNQNRGDKEPDQLGITAGGYLADLVPQLDLQIEYQRVSNWTFNQMHDRNRYLNDGRPIGAALGNDYDRGQLKLIRWWGGQLKSILNLSYYRQGEGRIDAEWTQPWVDAEGAYAEPFPTGTVQKTTTVSVGFNGFPTRFAFVDVETGVDWVKNLAHMSGDDRTLPFVRVYLSIFLLSGFGLD